jgi:fermentation-respiration switch protein FrsA (DUF1100 family)
MPASGVTPFAARVPFLIAFGCAELDASRWRAQVHPALNTASWRVLAGWTLGGVDVPFWRGQRPTVHPALCRWETDQTTLQDAMERVKSTGLCGRLR